MFNITSTITLDAIYFWSLERERLLVHVDPKVIQAMAAFVFISVLKDFLIGFYLHWTYEGWVKTSFSSKI